MQIILLILLLFIFNFIIRLLFVIGASAISTDEDVAFWLINSRYKHRFNYTVTNSIPFGYFAYPSITHWLISLFPKRHWKIVGYTLNIIYDCFSIIIFFIFLFYLGEKILFVKKEIIIWYSFYAALVYGLTPILFPVNARLLSYSARTFGLFMGFLFFMSLGIAFINEFWWLYSLTIITGILIIGSSQFAMQNMVLVSFFLSLFYSSAIPFTITAVSFGIAILINPFDIRKILKHKLNHYKWYFANRSGTGAENRNNLVDYVLLPVYLFTDLKKFIRLITNKLTIIIALYAIPILFVVFYIIIIDRTLFDIIWVNEWLRYFLALILGGIFAFSLTSLPPFLFLGEAERYLEMSAAFASALFVYFMLYYNWSECIILFVLLYDFCLINLAYIYLNKEGLLSLWKYEEKDCIIEFLNNLNEETRILAIPFKSVDKIDTYINNHKVKFYRLFMSAPNRDFKYMEEDLIKYDWPRPDFSWFQQRYGINAVLINRSIVEAEEATNIKYNFIDMPIICQSEKYVLYKL